MPIIIQRSHCRNLGEAVYIKGLAHLVHIKIEPFRRNAVADPQTCKTANLGKCPEYHNILAVVQIIQRIWKTLVRDKLVIRLIKHKDYIITQPADKFIKL